ncbi:MAG: hypothetical protein AAF685_08055 [Cyanobacteria bacterium P01_C01_bin.89]
MRLYKLCIGNTCKDRKVDGTEFQQHSSSIQKYPPEPQQSGGSTALEPQFAHGDYPLAAMKGSLKSLKLPSWKSLWDVAIAEMNLMNFWQHA